MQSEIKQRADFSAIRYAQCWEDADVLVAALDVKAHHVCLSIASAGDNVLAMLSCAPQRVIAIDLSAAQLACLELRVAAYRVLAHHELLELIGSQLSNRRTDLYQRCRKVLPDSAQKFWDARPHEIAQGIGAAGKFERYFALFRQRILPLIHNSETIAELLRDKPRSGREKFYDEVWNNWRWRALCKIFFSRFVMGGLGRSPAFFEQVKINVAAQILARVRRASVDLNPAENPYAQWILTGQHLTALPYALRPENFAAIRNNLDRLEIRQQSLEEFLTTRAANSIDRFNLSDIFEYVSAENQQALLAELARVSRQHARLAYWNLFVERRSPASMAAFIHPLENLANNLHEQDQAFFYQAFVLEEVVYDNCDFQAMAGREFDFTDVQRITERAEPLSTALSA